MQKSELSRVISRERRQNTELAHNVEILVAFAFGVFVGLFAAGIIAGKLICV